MCLCDEPGEATVEPPLAYQAATVRRTRTVTGTPLQSSRPLTLPHPELLAVGDCDENFLQEIPHKRPSLNRSRTASIQISNLLKISIFVAGFAEYKPYGLYLNPPSKEKCHFNSAALSLLLILRLMR